MSSLLERNENQKLRLHFIPCKYFVIAKITATEPLDLVANGSQLEFIYYYFAFYAKTNENRLCQLVDSSSITKKVPFS